RGATNDHRIGSLIQPLLNAIKCGLAFPTSDAALLARRAMLLEKAGPTRVRPVAAQHFARLLSCHPVCEALTGRADISIAAGVVDEVAAVVSAFGSGVRSQWPRNISDDSRLLAGGDFLALEVTPVGESLDGFGIECVACPLSHRSQVTFVDADVGHLVCDDEMMLDVDGVLHIVTDGVGAVALRRHGTRIRIGERDLRLARCQHLRLDRRQTPELRLERLHALRQPRNFGGRSRKAGDLLLAIRAIELLEIALDGALDGCHPFRQSVFREILLAVVHRLELAAVDRDRVTVEQMHAPAECDEAGADLADGWAIV